MKKYINFCDNVIKWNDLAGEDAFHNAKRRFYAKIHDLPCDIPSPDPDLYIDEIDWNSEIDPKLVLDLERKPKFPKGKKRFSGVVIMDSLLKDLGFSGPGWGDCEEEKAKNNEVVVEEKGWGDNTPCLDKKNGWGYEWNSKNSWGQNKYEDSKNRSRNWGEGQNSMNSLAQNKYDDSKNGEKWGDGRRSKNSWCNHKY